ncbi:MAG: NlpC/P60 family protein [Lachnospiraceae bacterium]
MKRRCRSVLSLLLLTILLMGSTTQVWADTIEELQKQILESQRQLDALNGQIGGLQEEQDLLEEEIEDLDSELINLYTEIGVLEDQITEKQAEITEKESEIEVAQADYDAAVEQEQQQYEAMKIRIKYMYEQGNESYLELLLESKGFSDMLNKVEYIEDLYEYDRKMLLNFQAIEEEIAVLKAGLEEDKAILESDMASIEEDKAELASQQNYLNGILAQKKAASANYDAEIAAAQAQASAYKKQIAADNKKIAQIQEEERKRLAAKNGTSTYTPSASAASTVAAAQAIVAASNGSSTGKAMANYGCQFIGNPYVPGGTSLTNGADCSGFIFRIYADFGYKVPRTSWQLRTVGTEVSLASAEPGDIVCYDGHVGMYIGGGMIVHASTQKTGIKVSNAQYRSILTIRRVV